MYALWMYHPTRLSGRDPLAEIEKDSMLARMVNLDDFRVNIRCWGKDAAIRWLMRQNGWNLATALAAVRLARQLSASNESPDAWEAYFWGNR